VHEIGRGSSEVAEELMGDFDFAGLTSFRVGQMQIAALAEQDHALGDPGHAAGHAIGHAQPELAVAASTNDDRGSLKRKSFFRRVGVPAVLWRPSVVA
jgi:hypothetical protein